MCRNTPISSDGPTFHGENPIWRRPVGSIADGPCTLRIARPSSSWVSRRPTSNTAINWQFRTKSAGYIWWSCGRSLSSVRRRTTHCRNVYATLSAEASVVFLISLLVYLTGSFRVTHWLIAVWPSVPLSVILNKINKYSSVFGRLLKTFSSQSTSVCSALEALARMHYINPLFYIELHYITSGHTFLDCHKSTFHSKRHDLDRFIRFYSTHDGDQQTDTQITLLRL